MDNPPILLVVGGALATIQTFPFKYMLDYGAIGVLASAFVWLYLTETKKSREERHENEARAREDRAKERTEDNHVRQQMAEALSKQAAALATLTNVIETMREDIGRRFDEIDQRHRMEMIASEAAKQAAKATSRPRFNRTKKETS